MKEKQVSSQKKQADPKALSPHVPSSDAAPGFEPAAAQTQSLTPTDQRPRKLPAYRPQRQAAVLRLQSQVGNQRVAALLNEPETAPVQPAAPVPPAAIQRDEDDQDRILNSDRDWIDSAMRTKNAGDVKQARDFATAEYHEKLTCIQILLKQSWYGPLDQLALARIWTSFPDPVEAAKFHITLWKKSVAAVPDLPEDVAEIAAEYDRLALDFEDDVLWIADSNLDASRTMALEEMQKYQVKEPEDSMAAATIPHEKAEQLRALQNAGRIVLRAQSAQRQIANTSIPYQAGEMDGPSGEEAQAQNYDWLYAEESALEGEFAKDLWGFDPNQPPPGEDPQAYATWTSLKENNERAAGVIQEVLKQFPALFPLLQAGSLEKLTEQVDAQQALGMIETRLSDVLANIDELRTAILPAIQDIDYRELKPIHRQLFAQGQTLEGVRQPWDESFYRWAGEKSIADFETSQFWMQFGLSLAEIGLLLFSGPLGLGTAGLIASLGMGALQAGISWERAEEMATAADAAMRADLTVISAEQASDAALDAILDTVFLAIDSLDLAGDLYKAGRRAAGAAGAAEAGLGQAGERLTPLQQALETVPADLREDMLTLYRKTNGFEVETVEMLARDPDLLYTLLEQPRAANLLRHCSDFCFPPDVTAAHLNNLDRIIKKLEDNTIPAKGLKEFLYQNQEDLEWAIKHVEDTLDEYLTSGAKPAWMADVSGSTAKGAKKAEDSAGTVPGGKVPGGAAADLPSASYSGLSVSVFWKAGSHQVYLTKANQIIGSHRSLGEFRAAHKEYAGWHSHHIIEEVHLRNLGIRSSFPARDDLPCVLLPPAGHSRRLRTILGQADTLKLSKEELFEYYEEAYDLLGDYSGANGQDELLTIVKKMLGIP